MHPLIQNPNTWVCSLQQHWQSDPVQVLGILHQFTKVVPETPYKAADSILLGT